MAPQLIAGDIAGKDASNFRSTLKTSGIKRIDTAARYANGESEKAIGAAKLPQDFTIDTKILFNPPGDGTLSAEAISKSLDNSLEALGVEKVNVLYCHAPDYATPIAEQAKAFHAQYEKGHFSHLGVSNFEPSMLQQWLDVAEEKGYVKPSVFQGHYNLLVRTYEETLFPLLRENGMVFNAYSPLGGGFLLGNFTEDGPQAGNRFSNPAIPYVGWYGTPALHNAVKKLRAISESSGISMGELSLRWLAHHSPLGNEDGIIIGGSKVSHLEASRDQVAKGPLKESVVRDLEVLFTEEVRGDAAKIVDFEKKG